MRFIFWIFFFVGAAMFQWWWSSYLSIRGVAPQCLLIFTVALAIHCGPISGQVLGFLWGLFLDMLGMHLFGAHALILSWIGYGVGRFRRQVDVTDMVPQALMIWILSLTYLLLYNLLGFLFAREFFWWGWKIFLFVPFFNVLVAPFVFYFVGLFDND
ncbi:MAG: rod shape-determining protein MreD [Elusimicrobia bacterium]|nr:rod shape-determining protein MreD [Elusimicrobiota bacterium]